MGNRTSISRRLYTYNDGVFYRDYTITNHNEQIHIFNYYDLGKVLFKFIKDGDSMYLKIKYNATFHLIDRAKTFKEGNTQYIEFRLNPNSDYSQDRSITPDVHLIRWHYSIQKIHFNYNSTVN
jgi:hypothetical protein